MAVTFVLDGLRAALLASPAMSPRAAGHPAQFPVSLGMRLIEALSIALLALMALLIALT
jgi:DNA modification methylase